MKKYSAVTWMILMTLIATPAAFGWSTGRVEICPFIGYGVGGDFSDRYGDYEYYGNIDLGDDALWGVRIGVGLAHDLGLEWQISHMPSAFFAGDESGFFSGRGDKITDVDLYNVQASLMFDLARGPVVPYIGFGLGASLFNMDQGEDRSRFSASLAGGLDFRFNRNLSFRTEVRGYGILINDSSNEYYDDYYYDDGGDEVLSMLETSFGLSFKL